MMQSATITEYSKHDFIEVKVKYETDWNRYLPMIDRARQLGGKHLGTSTINNVSQLTFRFSDVVGATQFYLENV